MFERLKDYSAEKGKQLGKKAGEYAGWYLIKGWGKLGADSFKSMYQSITNKEIYYSESDNKEAIQDIEAWLSNKKTNKKAFLTANEGERYLRMREKNGLNLQEIDKLYFNLSGLCLFFFALVSYCLVSGIYYAITDFSWWLISYLVTAILFSLLYINFTWEAACIYYRAHVDSKVFMKSPEMWIARFKLPDTWSIADKS